MQTWGRVAAYSDVAVNNQAFQISELGDQIYISQYLFVVGGGNIVYKNAQGNAQYIAAVPNNTLLPIGAQMILADGVVNGISRTTSATNITWMASNTLYNSP